MTAARDTRSGVPAALLKWTSLCLVLGRVAKSVKQWLCRIFYFTKCVMVLPHTVQEGLSWLN